MHSFSSFVIMPIKVCATKNIKFNPIHPCYHKDKILIALSAYIRILIPSIMIMLLEQCIEK